MKNCYLPRARDILAQHLWSSSVSNATKAFMAFSMVHYLVHATIANVSKRLLCKIESQERLANCWYCIGVSPRVSSLKEKSLVLVPHSVDSGGMIKIQIRYHRGYSSEIVKPTPIMKARQMCVQTKS